jgi:HD-like signal output (HDOD) protein
MNLSRDILINLGSNMPPSVGVFGRLQALLKDPDNDLSDIVDLVNVDPALTFQVIRLANSAAFGLRSRSESLEEAVARIGFSDVQRLVGLAVARQLCQGELTLYRIPSSRLWENSLAAGALIGALASAAGADGRTAYTSGLMRNIGKIVLNKYPGAQRYPGEEIAPDGYRWETETFGVNGAEIAAMLLDFWRFSAESIVAVNNHFNPAAVGDHSAAALRMHLACGFAVEWGRALPGESIGWFRNDEIVERPRPISAVLPASRCPAPPSRRHAARSSRRSRRCPP